MASGMVPANRVNAASRWYHDEAKRAIAFQVLVAVVLASLIYYFVSNTLHNMESRGIASGFGFLSHRAGFGILQSLIDYSESSSYGRTFFVGLLNTVLVSVLGIILATLLGFAVGVARLSNNWLLSRLAAVYIETFRNIPLLLQIFFWYFSVLRTLPNPRQSVNIGDAVFLNIRGLYMPAPIFGNGFGWVVALFVVAVVVSIVLLRRAHHKQLETGIHQRAWPYVLLLLIGLPGIAFVATGMPLSMELPALHGFNFKGGLVIIPELAALLVALTIVFLAVVFSLPAMAGYIEDSARTLGFRAEGRISLPILVSLLACLIPTTIGGLLSAVGISGIDRLVRRNVLAVSGRAVEVAGDIDVLMLDKTGTITFGNRMANEFLPAPGVDDLQLAEAAQLASLSDETPEGRSIVVLAKKQFGIRGRHMDADHIVFIPFSASTRMSGVDIAEHDGRPAVSIRKGAAESVAQWVKIRGGTFPQEVEMMVQNVARVGGTPLVVARGKDVLGVIYLKDIVKGGIRERFARLRAMGIRTVMVTGDNALTAASIAAEAGVDDFMAEATPEMKLARIREEQAAGRLVAMTGDGTNDAPALAQADVGVAMNTGTQAAREAGNMVDLDSNPTKLIEIVEIGKQMLITRGALTTFSFANDVAKYFAIIPAMFAGLFVADGMASGPLSALNIMGLNSPQSAILSTVIFNALVIVALIPLALKGVSYRPAGAASLLKRNILIYGVGGLIAPFMGIKLIDMVINAWRLV